MNEERKLIPCSFAYNYGLCVQLHMIKTEIDILHYSSIMSIDFIDEIGSYTM